MTSLESHLERQTPEFGEFFWHRLRWKAVSEQLPHNKQFHLLDIGAGAGLVGNFLANDFPLASYYFNEPLQSLNVSLQNRYGGERNRVEDSEIRDIDFVLLLDVIEHVENDRAFLQALLDRLQTGATVIITVPAFRFLWSWWDTALGHFRRYRKVDIERLASGLPVQVVEINYLFPEMVLPGLIRKYKPAAPSHPGSRAEFPTLPRLLNQLLTLLGTPSVKLRRWVPVGSSLIAVLRKKSSLA
jgi:SAM-dependent methyltransferase